MTMTLLRAQAKYGTILNGMWAQEALHASLWTMPADMQVDLAGWINSATSKPVTHIFALNDMHAALEDALHTVIVRNLASQLQTFDGCFKIRNIRGVPDRQSAHSWAGAIDINASTNRLGTLGDMSDALAECFTLQGFTWGKNFSRQDPMHFSILGW